MLWLPDSAERVGCRLPLADWSAPALLALAYRGADAGSADRLQIALAHDPALTLWALRLAAAGGRDDLRAVDALAQWLAENCNHVALAGDWSEETPDDESWRNRYRRLAASSMAVARRAGELSAGKSASVQHASLLGLVHKASDWAVLDRSYDNPAQGPLAGLPAWLASAVVRIGASPPDDSTDALSSVAQAMRLVDEGQALADYDRLTAGTELIASALAEAVHSLAAVTRLRGDWSSDFQDRLEAAKLAALGEFAAGAGHEINNPIAVIAGRAQLLLADETDARRRHELAVINTQAMRVYEMIADMMLFARPPAPQLAPCDVAALLREIMAQLAPKAEERGVNVNIKADGDPLIVNADPRQIAVAVGALYENALAVSSRGEKISIAVARRPANGANREAAVISVSDEGPGISDLVRRHLFDPFFSGREAGRGLGMGLAKTWRIVTNHDGCVEVTNNETSGATFAIILPL